MWQAEWGNRLVASHARVDAVGAACPAGGGSARAFETSSRDFGA